MAKLVFEEPLSQTSYKTLLCNSKIQKKMAKSEKFQDIAKLIIKNGKHNTIGRLSEFISKFLINFPGKTEKYFPFISDLFNFCNISYSSTMFMFIDMIAINNDCNNMDFWQKFFIEEKYFILNKLNPQSKFYQLPSSLYYATKNPTTTGNWQFLVNLANVPGNLNDLSHFANKSALLIEPLIYDDDSNIKNEYKEIQVHAIEFLTKMIENDSIKELSIRYEKIIYNIITIMKKFQHHNFALNACVNFIVAAINSDEMKNDIISIVYPFFIDTIQKNDINERFLIAFCKCCIDKIYLINETLTQDIPNSIMNQCYSWSKFCRPKSEERT